MLCAVSFVPLQARAACFMLYGSLFGGRQQRVRQPSNNAYDDRQQRC